MSFLFLLVHVKKAVKLFYNLKTHILDRVLKDSLLRRELHMPFLMVTLQEKHLQKEVVVFS